MIFSKRISVFLTSATTGAQEVKSVRLIQSAFFSLFLTQSSCYAMGQLSFRSLTHTLVIMSELPILILVLRPLSNYLIVMPGPGEARLTRADFSGPQYSIQLMVDRT